MCSLRKNRSAQFQPKQRSCSTMHARETLSCWNVLHALLALQNLPSEHSNPQALIPIFPPSTAHTHLSLFNGVKILLGLRPPLAAFRSHGGGVSACSPTACGLWRRKRTRFLLVEQATRCSSCFCLGSRRTEFSLSSSSSFPAKPVPVGAGNFFQLIWPVGGVRRLWALEDDLTDCLFLGVEKSGKTIDQRDFFSWRKWTRTTRESTVVTVKQQGTLVGQHGDNNHTKSTAVSARECA